MFSASLHIMTNHSQKTDQIAGAFQDQFEIVGFQRTSLDAIASSLHVSKKTIYKIFGSKRSILEHIVRKKSIQISNKMEKQLDALSTDRRKIEWLVSQAFQLSGKRIKKVLSQKNAIKMNYYFPHMIKHYLNLSEILLKMERGVMFLL